MDLIKREDAINAFAAECEGPYEACMQVAVGLFRKIPSASPKVKWIPVSKRLPEKNVEVLATTKWGSITIAERYGVNDWSIHEGATNAETDEIAAWMPLPEPWQGV